MRRGLILGLVGLGSLAGGALMPSEAGAAVRASEAIEISGEVDGLYPGSTAALGAVMTNPEAFAIRVTAAGATVSDASAVCPGTLLNVEGPTTAIDIAPEATAVIPFAVHMDLAAPDACQGETFALSYRATAVGATGALSPEPTSLAVTGASVVTLGGAALALVAVGVAARSGGRRLAVGSGSRGLR